mgnify:CR=1 FL=1
MIAASQRDVQEIGAVSVDFLQYSAYVLLAGFWLQAAATAQQALDAGINFFDTSNIYGNTPKATYNSEAFLGRALAPPSKSVRQLYEDQAL